MREDNIIIREFSGDALNEELIWHRDKRDREVEILEVGKWKFQRDNELPVRLSVGDKIFISAYEYHRVIKEQGQLKVRIKEY